MNNLELLRLELLRPEHRAVAEVMQALEIAGTRALNPIRIAVSSATEC